MINFVKDCVDEGTIPEILISGIESIERISPGQLRINYYRERRGEKVVVLSLIWDRQTWLRMWSMYDENRDAILQVVQGSRAPLRMIANREMN